MAKHRAFNADKFLDSLRSNESILIGFLAIWADQLDISLDTLTIDRFKEWLINSQCDAKDEIVEELHRVYDLCTPWCHEQLFTACGDFGYEPDPNHELPVECLALKIRTENEEAFNHAYARYNFWRAERFSVYRGKLPKAITQLPSRAKVFREKLAQAFKDHKNTDNVLVRHYREGALTNFVIYHEKRVKVTLEFKKNKNTLRVKPSIHRPLQQDFVSYNQETGQIEIESSYENEEATLRRTFADCLFDDKDFFDQEGADECVTLGVIANSQFQLSCPDGVKAKLVELHFGLDQEEEPFLPLRSKDVLRTLELNGLRRKLVGDQIRRAVFKIWVGDDKRGKRVEVYGTNRIRFNRSTHYDAVMCVLRDSEILLDAEDVVDLHAEPFGATGVADLALS